MVVLVVQSKVIPHLKAHCLLILITGVQYLNSMQLHYDIGHSVKRTVEIGAVALWYQFLLEKFSLYDIAKALFAIIVDVTHFALPCCFFMTEHILIFDKS